ncbi:MAG: C40 family peptidase [Bacteroidota bacterium]
MMKNLVLPVLFLLFFFPVYSQEPGSVAADAGPMNTAAGIDRCSLVAFATQYVGTPYRRAGSDPKRGFDCSGFVTYVFNHFKLGLPRSSGEYKVLGTALRPEEFRVGDVIVFYGFRDRRRIGHVGIVCEADGMKSRFIHASSGKAHSVTISDLGSAGYRTRFYKCIDVIR